GSLSKTSVLTDASGLAATTLTLGTAPGANTVTATVASAGVSGSPVTFTETAGATGIAVWTGAADGNWSNAGNWNPALVPGSGDSVVVGPGPNQPSLTATTSIAALSIATGGSVTLNAQTLSVARTLATTGTGLLVMTDPADLVQVGGNAVFDGGNELNSLSAGTLVIAGNLTQLATNSADSYHPSNTHITRFTGQNPAISFATPGLVPGSSHFENVEWTGTGTLTLGSNVMAHGTLSAGASGITGTITSAGHGLTLGGLNSVATVLDNTTLTIEALTAVPVALANVTFQGLPTSATQLTVDGPGAPTAGTVANFTFMPLTTGNTGFYVRANDTDGATPDVLSLTVTNDPGNGLAFTQQVNGAIVNWSGAPVIAWTGAMSTDWNTAGNWNPAVVPTATSFVTIPLVPNQPLIGSAALAQDVTVQTGATLTIDGGVGGLLVASGNLTVNGTLTGPSSQVSTLNLNAPSGSSVQLTALVVGGILNVQGSYNVATTQFTGTGQAVPLLSYADVIVTGSALLPASSLLTLTGNMSVLGQLDFNGGGLVTGGAFQTTGTGTITMTQTGELLRVGGAAVFAGASTAGLLTDGRTEFRGDFAQTGDPQAFAPSGNHVTLLNVIGAHAVFFTNPGPTQSHFNQLDVSGAGGAISLGSDIQITGSLTSTPGGAAPALDGSGNVAHILAAGANITSLDLTNATLALDGGPITSLSGINFQSYPDTATALTVRHPGQAAAFVLSNLTFGVVPTTGFYLRADDSNPSDGLTL
ncbi:MAG TPA: hypothetical protein VNH46_09035, partial [Gemmatimonadales bacterium]|nr:hypothetical protein [Gemmatimonadales bacterium]